MQTVKLKLTKIKGLLKEKFGFSKLRSGQIDTINELLTGNNVLAVLPTGSGKTLIYQLFGYLVNKPIVIVSPLLSLMSYQVNRMNFLGEKKVVALNSNQDWEQKQFALKHLNQYRYIFISPEMITNQQVLQKMKQLSLGLFVVDEAHCISKWGVDFRPDYLELGHVLATLNNPQVLMLTATASQKVQNDIIKKLQLKNFQKIIKSVDRPNIYLGVHKSLNELEKQSYLLDILKKLKGNGIIYFSSKKMANVMADMIQQKTGLTTAAYHSDLSSADRFKIQHQFMDNDLQIICATNAFGMGIDKSDVRFVIHYHMPQDLESYVQEIGRAGRDGKQSLAILLYAEGDEQIAANLIEHSLPTKMEIDFYLQKEYSRIEESKKNLLDFYFKHDFSVEQIQKVFQDEFSQKEKELFKMLDYIQCSGCRRKVLLANFDEEFDSHDEICCDFGIENNIDFSLFEQKLNIKVSTNDKSNWQQIINDLL
ncbi:ATP-dependent DNA helicase [Fructilactobacillus lindneri]|nr:ATP-dependent DNA helicase [Fructilactobacillus lindneri]